MTAYNAEPFDSLRDELTVLAIARALRNATPAEVRDRLAPFSNEDVRRLGQVAARREMLRRVAIAGKR